MESQPTPDLWQQLAETCEWVSIYNATHCTLSICIILCFSCINNSVFIHNERYTRACNDNV